MQIISPWVIQKLGLLDFWYYDEEEFNFVDGRMLLRGSNGSGKSVTMQSFIPLLLDGNKSAQRLDAFGSRERKMINYLLEDGDEREERTGYLYMEFKRADSNTYLTIGMANRAKKNGQLTSWYFYINDGRRINVDFDLYKGKNNKIALSKKELINRIGNGGAVIDQQKEYMMKINDLLFGFDTIENYQELLTLLIQLRQPKLSKDFKPTKLNEILTTSLTPLSEDDLRPMSEAVENMDSIQTKLDSLKSSKKACSRIDTVYQTYNKKQLYEKANNFISSLQQKDNFIKDKKATIKLMGEKNKNLIKSEDEFNQLDMELKNVKEEQRSLQSHKAFQLKEELEEVKQNHSQKIIRKQDSLNKMQIKQNKQTELNKSISDMNNELSSLAYDVNSKLEDMDAQSEGIFASHMQMCAPLRENPQVEISLGALQKLAQEQRKRISNIVSLLKEQDSNRKQLNTQEELLEIEKQKREDKERELEKQRRFTIEIKQELIEKINQWDENCELLHLQSRRSDLLSIIEVFSIENSYYELTDIVNDQKQLLEQELQEQHNALNLKYQDISSQVQKKQEELDSWIHKEDPEPVRSEEIERSRNSLREAGIPFNPLYKVIEFHPDIEDKRKNQLEEALEDMGILDAIIVDEQYRDQVLHLTEGKDKYLFSDIHTITEPITKLLEADPQINDIFLSQQINGILESISGQQNATTYIAEDGTYGIGVLHGKTIGNKPARFIGYRSRQRYREEQIQILQSELQELIQQRIVIEEAMEELQSKKATIQKEMQLFPKGDDLYETLRDEKKNEDELASIEELIHAKKEAVIQIQRVLNSLFDRITSQQNICGFKGNLKVYKQAEIDMDDYVASTVELREYTLRIKSLKEQMESLQDQLNDIVFDIDELTYQITTLDQEIQKMQMRMDSIEAQLADSGYENIKERIAHCVKRLDEIPAAQLDLKGNIKVLEKELQDLTEKANEFESLSKSYEEAYQQALICFESELKLGFLQMDTNGMTVTEVGKKIIHEYDELKDKELQDIFQQLSTRFHENREYLADYSLIQEEKEVSENSKRILLTARLSGVKVSFFELYNQITEDIEIQELLLSNKERELFEDILANTLGKKIRYKIQKSKEWVAMMNESMSSMDISSNLKLSLEWKNKQAEEEGQIGTRELVELLNMDSEAMSEAQMKKLAQHFRSKLVQARKRLEEKENTQTLHTIMKDIFDYRTWFEFQLFYEKGSEKRRELTNSRFLVFSGGEKAISMYVPLFSAAVAKYSGARSDAPRLICLDEAFAGVDDRNIGNMFSMMNDCHFQFILNSQSLWGDYETNPGMSIYQLETDNQAKFVTTMHYIWNGKKRLSVEEMKDYV